MNNYLTHVSSSSVEQKEQPLNLYDDKPKFLATGHGADIASQRADDLDLMALKHASARPSIFAIDIACGAGGQAIRLAQQGASVLATDIADMAEIIKLASTGLPGKVTFVQQDMRCLDKLYNSLELLADVVICQRAIHYLRFSDAIGVIDGIKKLLAPDGRLYLSASGIHSELGEGYAGREFDLSLSDRYGELAPAMRDKHGIHGPVCLYSEEDMAKLLINGGLVPEIIFSSKFGNIKVVARHV